MKVLITGSAGHLGEGLMRSLGAHGHETVGLDVRPSPFTHFVGSIADRQFVAACVRGMDAVIHAAALHKPHLATHTRQDFVDVNVTGTLNLLEESIAEEVRAFVFTSTTSTFGHALSPPPGEPAAWIDEGVTPIPKNVYGVTKLAAENLCEMIHYRSGMPCVVLRTSRFFLEDDDDREARERYSQDNLKVNELLHRRVDMEDAIAAHALALRKAADIGFDRFIISAPTPLRPEDLATLGTDAPAAVRRHVPSYEREYARRDWLMSPRIDRVYTSAHAQARLGWQPRYDFRHAIRSLGEARDFRSPLALTVGSKGYHDRVFEDGPYPVESQPARVAGSRWPSRPRGAPARADT